MRQPSTPTYSDHEAFARAVQEASSAADIERSTLSHLLTRSSWNRDTYANAGIAWHSHQPWTQYIPLARRSEGISPKLAKPSPTEAIEFKRVFFPGLCDEVVCAALRKVSGKSEVKSHATPAPGIFWPVVAIQVTDGDVRYARLKNLYNSAVVLDGLRELWLLSRESDRGSCDGRVCAGEEGGGSVEKRRKRGTRRTPKHNFPIQRNHSADNRNLDGDADINLSMDHTGYADERGAVLG